MPQSTAGEEDQTPNSAAQTVEPVPRILLVEDNEINQIVALRILKKLGYATDLARNGVEALSMLAAGGHDLILMDVQMPRMDGLEATRRIRSGIAVAGKSEIPIIAVTANALPENRKQCLDAGMNAFTSKPIDPAILRDLITRELVKEDGQHRDLNRERRFDQVG
ncbi:MAG: response regulator [bacterium]|nr:response regulator [bacterium]